MWKKLLGSTIVVAGLALAGCTLQPAPDGTTDGVSTASVPATAVQSPLVSAECRAALHAVGADSLVNGVDVSLGLWAAEGYTLDNDPTGELHNTLTQFKQSAALVTSDVSCQQ